jgi:hypothetical protein
MDRLSCEWGGKQSPGLRTKLIEVAPVLVVCWLAGWLAAAAAWLDLSFLFCQKIHTYFDSGQASNAATVMG